MKEKVDSTEKQIAMREVRLHVIKRKIMVFINSAPEIRKNVMKRETQETEARRQFN